MHPKSIISIVILASEMIKKILHNIPIIVFSMKLKFKGNYINPRERKGVRKYIAVISPEKFEINEMLVKLLDSTYCANAHNYLGAGLKCDFEYDYL